MNFTQGVLWYLTLKKITKNSNFNVFISTLVCIRTNLKCTENLYKKPKRLKIKKQTNFSNVVLLWCFKCCCVHSIIIQSGYNYYNNLGINYMLNKSSKF